MPGTASVAASSSHPRVPVPIEANCTRSLGATARPAAHKVFGSSRVNFTAAPAATEPVPIRIKSRRVKECILFLSLSSLSVRPLTKISDCSSQHSGRSWRARLGHSLGCRSQTCRGLNCFRSGLSCFRSERSDPRQPNCLLAGFGGRFHLGLHESEGCENSSSRSCAEFLPHRLFVHFVRWCDKNY